MIHACRDKCYGRRRIIAELSAKGFDRETVQEAFRLFESELDYDEARAKLLKMKFGTDTPEPKDIKEKQKIMNTLFRYGH